MNQLIFSPKDVLQILESQSGLPNRIHIKIYPYDKGSENAAEQIRAIAAISDQYRLHREIPDEMGIEKHFIRKDYSPIPGQAFEHHCAPLSA